MTIFKKIAYGLIKKLKFLPPEFYIKIYYEYYTGKPLNLKSPVEFNEKIQWLKVYYKPELLTKLVDKYEVRDFIKNKIGETYLTELIGVYKSYDEIDFNKLPQQFVLKGTHGSNYNLIVKDKTQLNKAKVRQLVNKWLGRNYYYRGGLEWAYKNVPPRVIAEAFMKDEKNEDLPDYKFFCFNGLPKMVQIDLGRQDHHTRVFYDLSWNKLPITKGKIPMYQGNVDKPETLDEMSKLAKVLSESFPFARVDFFSVNGNTKFGEITFYPGDGRTEFYPEKYNTYFGDLMRLPSIPKNQNYITEIN